MRWEKDESLARPLVPFGMFDGDPTSPRYQYHKCLGYFSVRFIAAVQKWVMLYTCSERAHSPRGIYMRSATLPWGPWSIPERIFDPDDGYCHFMHRPQGCLSGVNPFEEEKRSLQFFPGTKSGPTIAQREIGGEYAPFLLPSRYAKPGPNGQIGLYYLLSTWNPYQVVLMRSQVDLGSRP